MSLVGVRAGLDVSGQPVGTTTMTMTSHALFVVPTGVTASGTLKFFVAMDHRISRYRRRSDLLPTLLRCELPATRTRGGFFFVLRDARS